MPKIAAIRPILLSSPYADPEDPEIKECFPNGAKRTIGMVEITLDDGTRGLGEGYLAVFAPLVFREIVNLCAPHLIGAEAFDIAARLNDLGRLCNYWSSQGAARHVISAFDIALHDAMGRHRGVPVHALLGRAQADNIAIYGSGGCCDSKALFAAEFALLEGLGIEIYKMRAVKGDLHRTAWVMEEAARRGIKVAVDMCQNLAEPPQPVADVVAYVQGVRALTPHRMAFVEEALGPDSPDAFRALRAAIDVPVAGGETLTTPQEMIRRIAEGAYDLVQPDASVIGGLGAVMQVFAAAKGTGTGVVVHAWGGAAAIMASYHAAFAGGGDLVEYPMLDFPLGREMIGDSAPIRAGRLQRPDMPGLGLTLTPEIEARYPFDPTAVYCCLLADYGPPPDRYWA